jgi:FLVCR family feline leukemia virus subgroup C receptor-related protein
VRFSNPFGFVEYSPILKIAAQYFHQSEEHVLLLPNLFSVLYILFAFCTIAPMEKRLDYSLYLAITFNALGYWINYLGGSNFYYQIVGFVFIAGA